MDLPVPLAPTRAVFSSQRMSQSASRKRTRRPNRLPACCSESMKFYFRRAPRAAGLDIQRLDRRAREPRANRLGNELRAVVAADVLGPATHREQFRQHVDHPVSRDPAAHLQGQTLPRVLVHDRQPFQRPALVCPVVDEVPRPDVIFVLRPMAHNRWRRAPNSVFSAAFAAP